MINEKEARFIAQKLGVSFCNFSFEDFLVGLNIELEHGTVSPRTNVTNDDLEMTAKIALAHLNEFDDYYNNDYGLPAMERALKRIEVDKKESKN